MPLVIVAIGVILLLLLMIRFKMNGFIALVLVALAVGLMQGMPLDKVIGSIKAGVGGTLTDGQLAAADIDGDGTVNSTDVYYLMYYIALNGAGIHSTWEDVLQ